MARKRYDARGREMFTISDAVMSDGAAARPATKQDLDRAKDDVDDGDDDHE